MEKTCDELSRENVYLRARVRALEEVEEGEEAKRLRMRVRRIKAIAAGKVDEEGSEEKSPLGNRPGIPFIPVDERTEPTGVLLTNTEQS